MIMWIIFKCEAKYSIVVIKKLFFDYKKFKNFKKIIYFVVENEPSNFLLKKMII